MRAAERLGNDLVYDPEVLEIGSRQLQRLRGLLRIARAAPQDRCAAFGRDHRIDRMFEHDDVVRGGERYGPAAAPFADDGGNERRLYLEARFDRARDGFGLAARLGLDAGIR